MAPSLAGKYKLRTINGADAGPIDTVLELTAEADPNQYRIHTLVINSINGSLKYADGKLKGMLMLTKVGGPPAHMEVEYMLVRGFDRGMSANLEGKTLTLSADADVLVYVAV